MVKEDLAERDGQLQMVKMNLETAQRQNEHHCHEIERYEQRLGQMQSQLEQSQEENNGFQKEVRC